MKICNLKVSNYRCYKNLDVDFDPKLTVLVGLNGQGKTALLDAIAVAFGSFIGGFDDGKDSGFKPGDVICRQIETVEGDFAMEPQYPVAVNVTASFPHEEITWHRELRSRKGRTTQAKQLNTYAKSLQNKVRTGESIDLPLLAQYGTGRLWNQMRLTEGKQGKSSKSRLVAYTDCLNPASSYRAFAEWYRTETISEYERQLTALEKNSPVKISAQSLLLKALQNAVNQVLSPSQWSSIRYSAQQQQIIGTHEQQGDIPVSSLSDGIRNMIGLVADIAYRAIRLNPHLKEHAVKETQGIVLIDEIDMHLHPMWQQLILQDLNKAFPKIQFIVTTHSPHVLSTIKKKHIRLLGVNVHEEMIAAEPLCNTYGQASNDVLEQVMHVSPKPDIEPVRWLNQYFDFIDQNLSQGDKALQLRKKLEDVFGADHPSLQKADRMIRRMEFLGI